MPNHVINKITFLCDNKTYEEILAAIQKDDDNDGEFGNFGAGTFDFRKLIPEPDYPVDDILDWHRKNWGTKWNAYCDGTKYYDGTKDNSIYFYTAWNPPRPVIRVLHKMFPNVHMVHNWADEDIGYNLGCIDYDGNKVTVEEIPKEERRKFALDLWGYTEEDLL